MLKGEDIVLLLKLTHVSPDWTVRTLERETTIPKSVVQRSLKRLWQAGLLIPGDAGPTSAKRKSS